MIRRYSVPVVIPDPTPTPGTPTRPSRTRQAPLRVLFTGADGSVWDLTGGPVRLGRGVQGLFPPDVENVWQVSSGIAGAAYRGFRHMGPQEVVLPMHVQAAPGLPWRDLDDRLWEALVPGVECRVTVTAQDGLARWRPLYFVGVSDAGVDVDPTALGFQTQVPRFESPDPYWRGAYEPIELTPRTDFPTLWQHVGGVMNLAPVNARGSAVLRNDGDVESHAVITAVGSMDGFIAGVSPALFEYGPVATGQTIHVDMHPAAQTVGFARGSNDEAAWDGVKRRSFAPIPPRSSANVRLEALKLSPGASLVVVVPQLFRRPWGRRR